MRIRVLAKAASVVALIVAVLIGCLWYPFLGHRHVKAQARPADFRSTADALQSTNAPLILAAADHFYWLNNGPAAAPLYARAEKLFLENGDKRNELRIPSSGLPGSALVDECRRYQSALATGGCGLRR